MTMMSILAGAAKGRSTLSYTFSSNTANASLNVTSISGYSAGMSDITITVNAGVYLYSTSTGTPGLTLSGGNTGDTVTLVNNGYIMGKGGDGVYGYANGANGGTAISLGFDTTINNTNASAYIGGGGGSGAATNVGGSGGGAGGGAGGYSDALSSYIGRLSGGAGGSIGNAGSNGNSGTADIPVCGGAPVTVYGSSGAGGGRIFSGSGGNGSAMPPTGGGAGGGGGTYYSVCNVIWGTSGGSGSNAASNTTNSNGCGGGGGWGASGGKCYSGATPNAYNGGAGGKAVALNSKTVTWVSGNTTRVYGAIS